VLLGTKIRNVLSTSQNSQRKFSVAGDEKTRVNATLIISNTGDVVLTFILLMRNIWWAANNASTTDV
jgi:hypothetical protein